VLNIRIILLGKLLKNDKLRQMFFSTFCLTCLVVYFCRLSTLKYGQLANPICIYAPLFLMQTVIAPLIFYKMGLFDNFGNAAVRTVWISCLYFLGVAGAFAVKTSPLQRVFVYVLPKQDPPGIGTGALLLFIILFFCLMLGSGVGTLWITSPRVAYQYHRTGVGVLWSLSEAFLVVSFIGVLVRQQSRKRIFFYAFLYAFLAYFLGSKGFMLLYFVLAILYIQHRLKPLSIVALGIAATCALLLQQAMQFIQGTARDYSDAILYFDYFSNTAMFLHRFNEFKHTWGATMLGDMWLYVPRALYPAKPFAYGQAVIMDHFFPDQAALGQTPGTLTWAGAYLDFGIFGVFANGLFLGFVAKAAYELFRASTKSTAFVFFSQVGMLVGISVFANAPLPIFILWLSAVYALFRYSHQALAHAGSFSKQHRFNESTHRHLSIDGE